MLRTSRAKGVVRGGGGWWVGSAHEVGAYELFTRQRQKVGRRDAARPRQQTAYGIRHTAYGIRSVGSLKTYRLTNLKLPGAPGVLLRAEGADAEEVLVAGEVDFDGDGGAVIGEGCGKIGTL